MNSSSISTFAPYSPTQYRRLRYPHHRPTASPFFPKSLSVYAKLQPTAQLRPNKLPIPPKPIHRFRVLPVPWSNPSLIPSLSTQTLKFLAENVVFLLLGSFIFMGSYSTRPVMAIPADERTYSENKEEKRDTRNGKSEDDEMYLKILEEDPKNLEALKVIVYRKMRERKTKDAAGYVERLIAVQPEEVEWRLLRALCYEEMGNLSKAKRLFREILEENPLLLRALHV